MNSKQTNELVIWAAHCQVNHHKKIDLADLKLPYKYKMVAFFIMYLRQPDWTNKQIEVVVNHCVEHGGHCSQPTPLLT